MTSAAPYRRSIREPACWVSYRMSIGDGREDRQPQIHRGSIAERRGQRPGIHALFQEVPHTGGGNGDCNDSAWTRMCPEAEREQAAIRPLKVEAIRIGVCG